MNYSIVLEAIHSVAASHPPDCDCRNCRAAAGDSRALEEIVMAVAQVVIADEEARAA